MLFLSSKFYLKVSHDFHALKKITKSVQSLI